MNCEKEEENGKETERGLAGSMQAEKTGLKANKEGAA